MYAMEFDLIVIQAPREMMKLFSHMVDRADSFYRDDPIPFLQYIIMGRKLRQPTLVSELLFTMTNQEQLDECLHDKLSAHFIRLLNDKALTIEAQVPARCAGLIRLSHYSGADGRTLDESDRSFQQNTFNSPPDETIDISTLDRLSYTNIRFIHRTAYEFLSGQPRGSRVRRLMLY